MISISSLESSLRPLSADSREVVVHRLPIAFVHRDHHAIVRIIPRLHIYLTRDQEDGNRVRPPAKLFNASTYAFPTIAALAGLPPDDAGDSYSNYRLYRRAIPKGHGPSNAHAAATEFIP